MMKVTAKLSNLAISPRKVRLIADLIRGASVQNARQQLLHSPQKAARPLLKLLDSAAANAENNHKLDADKLTIASITVNPAAMYKRYQPRAFGRASTIRKRMSHVHIMLEALDSAAGRLASKKQQLDIDQNTEEKEPKRAKSPEKKGSENNLPADTPKPEIAKHEPEVFDPRRVGHEKKNQHIDKKQKEKHSIKKTPITRTHNK